MTIFDLFFLVVFLVSVIVLITALIGLLRGRSRQVVKILAVYGVCLAIYLGVVAGVSLASPQRTLALGEDRCFDDWCISVRDAVHSEVQSSSIYTITFQISSRARRVAQRENGIVVYLLDESGHRYDVEADPSEPAFNTLLQPGQKILIQRTFVVSRLSGQIELGVAHEGSARFPGSLIIGDDSSLFHKPTVVRLP